MKRQKTGNGKAKVEKFVKRFVTGKMSVAEIAEAVGCTPSNVYFLFRTLGVSRKTKVKLANKAKKAAKTVKAASEACTAA